MSVFRLSVGCVADSQIQDFQLGGVLPIESIFARLVKDRVLSKLEFTAAPKCKWTSLMNVLLPCVFVIGVFHENFVRSIEALWIARLFDNNVKICCAVCSTLIVKAVGGSSAEIANTAIGLKQRKTGPSDSYLCALALVRRAAEARFLKENRKGTPRRQPASLVCCLSFLSRAS